MMKLTSIGSHVTAVSEEASEVWVTHGSQFIWIRRNLQLVRIRVKSTKSLRSMQMNG
jgi:hypothetical protein